MKNNVLGLDLKIDQDYIGKCVSEIVKAGMLEALDVKNELAGECVKAVLNTRVDKEGKPSTSSWDKDTLIQYLLRKFISDLARNEIMSVVEEKRPEVKELIKKELSKESTLNTFVNSFFNNVSDTLAKDWKTNINIQFEQTKESDY